MSKKNLDKLFREKLEDFTDVPTEKVWKSIEASLNKKKENRKVIPIWWKLGGIAAALAIGLFLMNPWQGDVEINPTITNTENSGIKVKDDKDLDLNGHDSSPQVTESESSNTDVERSIDENKANTPTTNIPSGIVTSDDKKEPNNASLAITEHASPSNDEDQNIIISSANSQETVAVLDVNPDASETNPSDTNASKDKIENAASPSDEILGNISQNLKEGVAENEPDQIIDAANKKSIFDEIAENKKEEVAAKSSGKKWSAGPSVAPVYFNGMGDGSPVHPIFVPNSKSGDVNLSYGLTVSYEISRKLSVKTGIHKVDYGYNTNDVEFSSSLESFAEGQLSNIDYSSTSRNIIVESKANDNAFTASKEAVAQDPSLYGIMAQQLGYLEVPIELNYALLDKKFGINLIGGLSSLFLMDNAVTLTSGELVAEMGEANNVNDVNFSTNVGFGLNYKFTQKIQFNVEPVFKYQLNTFSETSGNFRPFTVGVYSGLNFKF